MNEMKMEQVPFSLTVTSTKGDQSEIKSTCLEPNARVRMVQSKLDSL